MAQPRPLSEQDLNDILDGACILGAGGGGPYSIGRQIVDYLAALPRPVLLADADADVADDQTMAVSAVAGSPDAAGATAFPMDIAGYAFEGLNTLRSAAGDGDFSFVLPGEVGAGNTFIPMTVAAQRGIPIIDAAGARRAIPKLTMCTYASERLAIDPIVIADQHTQISFTAPDAGVAEGPMRGIISGGGFASYAGIALWPMSGVTMKGAALRGTTTYARLLGAALREAKTNKQDPVQAVVAYLGGSLLFSGTMLGEDEVTQGGFDLGTVILRDQETGEQVIVYNQNENLIAWSSRRDRPLAMAPDLICYLTADGLPFSNADPAIGQGKTVALIGAPSTAELREPSIVAAFLQALQAIGYGGPYVPIENLR